MDLFEPAPEPPTELGRYRVLAARAGVRVSPLQLGAMSIGSAWGDWMGSMDKTQSFKLLDAYYEAGGNYIDTANNYQDQESETWLGEWMKERGNRDNMVIATKYTIPYKLGQKSGKLHAANHAGNHKRSMYMSLRDSLAKLQTEWVDVLYLHIWDHTSSIEEIMDSLHIFVEQGKVLYLGISDTPAWVVAAANTYAMAHGKTPFSIYQGRWNIIDRGIERDIVPMCRHFGMAIAPWAAMGGGKFQTKKQLEEREKNGEGLRTMRGAEGQSADEIKISEALAKVAEEHGTESVTAIALAWVMSKAPQVYPIVGGRKVEHLKYNIWSLSIRLTDKQMEFLESQVPYDPGFPHTFIGQDPAYNDGKPVAIVGNAAPFVAHIKAKSILHQ